MRVILAIVLGFAILDWTLTGVAAATQRNWSDLHAVTQMVGNSRCSSCGVECESQMLSSGELLQLTMRDYEPSGGEFYDDAIPASASVVVNGESCPTWRSQAGEVHALIPSALMDFHGGANHVVVEAFDERGRRIFFEELTNLALRQGFGL